MAYRPVPKRGLCKQGPFLGNGSVNTFRRQKYARNNKISVGNGVFYVDRAATVVKQRRGKHASTTIEGLGFLHGPCRGVILKTIGATQSVVICSFVRETVKIGPESVKLKNFHC
jgi:hypothetical protein